MANFIEKEVTNKSELENLYNKSALTFEGVGRTSKNIEFVLQWLEKYNATLKNTKTLIWWCSGELMNNIYNLSNSNAYPNDSNIMIIDSDTILLDKVIIPRFEVGGRWLDDVIDNNLRRESQ